MNANFEKNLKDEIINISYKALHRISWSKRCYKIDFDKTDCIKTNTDPKLMCPVCLAKITLEEIYCLRQRYLNLAKCIENSSSFCSDDKDTQS